MQEMQVQSLGQEDPMEEEMATHSRIIAGEIPWTEEPGWLQFIESQRVNVQAGFRKGRGTRDQIANISWIIEKARELQKNIYLCFIDCAKAFDCGSQQTVENSERNGYWTT